MKRTLILLLTVLLVLAGSAATVTAAKDDKNDNKATAEACKKDGWRTLTDEDKQPFKNQGQCMKYVKDGGELNLVDDEVGKADKDEADKDEADADDTEFVLDQDDEPSLKIMDGTKPWDGFLEGTGFTPGEEVTKVTFESDRETLNLTSPVGTIINDDGTFTTERIIYWCSEFHGYGETSGTVTVEDSAGETYSQTFVMDTHCGPKE